MQAATRSFALAVESSTVQQIGEGSNGWVVGLVCNQPIPPSPAADWVDTRRALRKLIASGNFATASPSFLAPLAGSKGVFRDVSEMAVQDFLSLERQDDSVRHFVRLHGVFAHENLEPTNKPTKVRRWWKAATRDGIPFALSVDRFLADRDEMEMTHRLWSCISTGDELKARELCFQLGPLLIKGFDQQNIGPTFPTARVLVSAQIARHLETARIAPVEVNGQTVPAITTSAVRDALYVRLMDLVSNGQTLRVCEYHLCRKTFVPTRADSKHCTPSCQNRAKSTRQKERQRNTMRQ